MATPTSNLYRLVDEKLGGQLAERLTFLRADERSWRWIARKLAPEFGAEISAETLRAWGDTLGIPSPDPEQVAS